MTGSNEYGILLPVLILIVVTSLLAQNIGDHLKEVDAILKNISGQVEGLENNRKACWNTTAYLKEATPDLRSLGRQCTKRIRGRNGSLPEVTKINRDLRKISMPGTYRRLTLSSDALDLSRGRQKGSLLRIQVPMSVRRCLRSFEDTPISLRAAQINCLQAFLWEFKPGNRTVEKQLQDLVNMDNIRVPPAGNKVRKEYRTLTTVERAHFHNALNRLYRNGMLKAFGQTHALMENRAHGGPAFLPWHRAFLALFEQALHQEDPSVSLPYWDSTIDFEMDNPVNSVIWTPQYFGTGTGVVSEGPFAEWVSLEGRLERKFGDPETNTRLMNKADIHAIMDPNRCTLGNMTNELEIVHGGVHLWVGGDMGSLDSAAYDPIFYMHHAFIDYVWEKYRQKQASDGCNVNPETDYPRRQRKRGHGLPDKMGGMEFFTNKDGLGNWWTGGRHPWYRYEDTPTCPDCGGADSLVCDSLGVRRRCVPKSTIAEFVMSAAQKVTTPVMLSATTVFTTTTFAPLTTECEGDECEVLPPPEVRKASPQARFGPEEVEAPLPEDLPTLLRSNIERAQNAIPRNRGKNFVGPVSDGRNLLTAFEDALRVAELKRHIQERK